MPAAYAHYTFGCECLKELPDEIRQICLQHRDLFDLGVHGPDILFYYDFLKSNRINRFGETMHHHTGRAFFRKCRQVYQETGKDPAVTAYIFGFLAHFALDKTCHPYVNQMDKETDFSHNAIEAAFESHLITRTKKAGTNPASFDRRRLLRPSYPAARTIALFFPFSEEEIFKALKGQVKAMGLLYSPTGIKKNILRFLIHHLPVSDSLGDLFPDNKTLPALCEAAGLLENLMAKALEDYIFLSSDLLNYLEGREDQLSPAFDADFEGLSHSSL